MPFQHQAPYIPAYNRPQMNYPPANYNQGNQGFQPFGGQGFSVPFPPPGIHTSQAAIMYQGAQRQPGAEWRKSIAEAKDNSPCHDCQNTGHWKGDRNCPNPQYLRRDARFYSGN